MLFFKFRLPGFQLAAVTSKLRLTPRLTKQQRGLTLMIAHHRSDWDVEGGDDLQFKLRDLAWDMGL